MDAIDKKLLNLLQREFPLVLQPYAAVAEKLGISELDAMGRAESLLKQGILRKIGASVAPQTVGHTTTLIAAKVQPEKLGEVADAVNAFPEVTHNYGREHEFNLWFTLVCQDRSAIERICGEIKKKDGVIDLMELPATHLFKLDVFFDMCEEECS
jgi:DNA-binding Lrp family transcriptional regulator